VDSPALPEAGTAFSLRFPVNGANLPAATARDARLEIAVDASLLPSVEVSLDGARSRPIAILPDPPKLSDLGDLTAGDHYLVATLRTAPNLPARHAVVRFGVGAEPSPHPLVFCNRPEGTVYAAPDAKLLLDFVTDGFRLGGDGSVRVQIKEARTGKLRFESLLTTSTAREFTLPGSDDFAVELALLDARGQVLDGKFARDRCEVTRNEVAP
jgi:hypothetical protein